MYDIGCFREGLYRLFGGGEMDKEHIRRVKLMAKPIEATPVLRGDDLVTFAKSLSKTASPASVAKRASARSLLKRVTK
jgi:hypothetical protein